MEKKELERLERIEEKLDILFDLIKGKLTTGVYTSGNTDRITLPVTMTEEEKDIEGWEKEWEITPVYNQVSFIRSLLDKARGKGYIDCLKEIIKLGANFKESTDIRRLSGALKIRLEDLLSKLKQ